MALNGRRYAKHYAHCRLRGTKIVGNHCDATIV